MDRVAKRSLVLLDLSAMVALVALAGTVMILWAHVGHEMIPVREGIGYDGTTYSAMTRDPMKIVFGGILDVHRIQRVVPSLVVYSVLRPFDLNESNPAIVIGFQVLNFALMAAAAYVWWLIARRLNLSRPAGWVGFLALLVNYGLIKVQAYSPVMTDTFGFFLGLVVLACVVFKRPGLLPWVAVLGAFTWPTVTYSALGLYVFSRPGGPLRPNRWWGVAVAGIAAIAIPVLGVYSYRCGSNVCPSPLMYGSVVPGLMPISVVVLAALIYLALRPVVEVLTVPAVLRALDWRRLIVAVVLMLLISRVQHDLADPSFRTVSRTLYNTALGGLAKPAGNLVAHAVYYGPALLLLALTWRRAVREVRQFGAGFVALLFGFLLIAVTNEARILMNEWPMFALMAAIVVDKLEWRRFEVVVFGLLALVTSRLWFPVNHGPYVGHWSNYPEQYYGMSLGLKMTMFSYTLMGLGCLVSAGILYWLLHRRRPSIEHAADERPVADDAVRHPVG
jgi:hypothetical protein